MVVGLVMVCRSQACVGSSPSLPARGRRNACFSCAVSPASSTGELRGAGVGHLGSTGCRGVRSTGGSVRRAECEGGDVGMRSGTLRLRGGADAGGGNVAAPNGQVPPACERSNRFSRPASDVPPALSLGRRNTHAHNSSGVVTLAHHSRVRSDHPRERADLLAPPRCAGGVMHVRAKLGLQRGAIFPGTHGCAVCCCAGTLGCWEGA